VALAWGDEILGSLSNKARTRFAGGRFLPSAGDTLRFGLPNEIHRDRCTEVRGEVDDALEEHFGHRIDLELTVDDGSAAPADLAGSAGSNEPVADGEDEIIDVTSLEDAADANETTLDRLTKAFPGSELVEVEDD